MEKRAPIKVFLSYAKEDLKIARQVYNALKGFNIDVWFDEVSLVAGQHWKNEIMKEIRDCNYFVALLSSNSVNKRGFVNKELKEALDCLEEFPDNSIFLIPARIDECNPSHNALSQLHWADLFPDWNKGIKMILKAIGVDMMAIASRYVVSFVDLFQDISISSLIERLSDKSERELWQKVITYLHQYFPSCALCGGIFGSVEDVKNKIADNFSSPETDELNNLKVILERCIDYPSPNENYCDTCWVYRVNSNATD